MVILNLTTKSRLVVAGFRTTVLNKYLRHCDPKIPFHWFAIHVGDIMRDAMMLLAMRPMHVTQQIRAPDVDVPTVLSLSIQLLNKHREIMTTPFTEPWRWFGM